VAHVGAGGCERLALLAQDEDRRAMWARRRHLHATGQHGKVYDGAGALARARAMRQGGGVTYSGKAPSAPSCATDGASRLTCLAGAQAPGRNV
jgi:hypothetical protein